MLDLVFGKQVRSSLTSPFIHYIKSSPLLSRKIFFNQINPIIDLLINNYFNKILIWNLRSQSDCIVDARNKKDNSKLLSASLLKKMRVR